MPVRKFRSVEDMPPSPLPPLDPRNLRLACDLSTMAARLWRLWIPAGVYKHRSLEAAQRLRRSWGPERAVGETCLKVFLENASGRYAGELAIVRPAGSSRGAGETEGSMGRRISPTVTHMTPTLPCRSAATQGTGYPCGLHQESLGALGAA